MDRLFYNWILPALIALGLFYPIADIIIKMIGPMYLASLGF